jgi:hypothetical protein
VALTSYAYSISVDFPQATVDADKLTLEITNSTITSVLQYIETAGDVCTIWFDPALSGPEVTTLNGLVAAHAPLGGGSVTLNTRDGLIVDATWAGFKKYLDGTIAYLYFFSQATTNQYTITTEQHGGFKHQYVMLFTDVADKLDFDTNFLPQQGTRRPYEQLAFTVKGSVITYLGGGDIDKIETTVGAKKTVQQFNYVGANLTGITTTIVDA